MNRKSLLGVACIAASLPALAQEAHSAQGDLDPTFGQGGRVVTNLAVPRNPAFTPSTGTVLVQPDGRILVSGRYWHDGASGSYGTFLVRYLRDGTLDPSFGDQGKVAVIAPGFPANSWTVGADMTLQEDGKIVLIGQYTLADGIIVQRYTSSGMLDTTFGDHGTAAVPRSSEFTFSEGLSIGMQLDGKIVGVGWEFELGNPYYDAILVFRLNENGSLDWTFGPSATGVERIIDGYGIGKVLVRPNGQILVAGTLLNFSKGYTPTPLLARYTIDGSLDPTFGSSGVATHRIGGMNSQYSSAAVQPDGKIVAIGQADSDSGPLSFVARYNSDGTPDSGFGTNGVFSIDFFQFQYPQGVVVTPDRKIVAIGSTYDAASDSHFIAILRLTADGEPDPGFGTGGMSVLEILNDDGSQWAYPSDVAIQHDGRVLVAGHFFGDGFIAGDSISLIRVTAGPRYSRPRRPGISPTPAPEPVRPGFTVLPGDGAP